ncbi:sialate O-acetylesterase [Spirosoma sp.]|uniref:sialate O-acetylesterase n=1 Tax=Spirosoma sp. TaxID=1899569 RepID=UPI00260C5BD7|nr:sialate O-acetylesterase [Spirosoma sp.]MCX6215691.1 sialate O-acetylesterase [Spirosoma sp.]
MKIQLRLNPLLFLLLLGVCVAFRQDVPPRLKLFLLIGQSNMAGRGIPEAEDKQPHGRIWMLTKEQTWVPARDPLHFDKPAVIGVGPGLAFAQKLVDSDEEVNVGLIPCAQGGSGIDVWVPDAYYAATKSYPYDDAIKRAKKALENGELAGILWHQGESDSQPEKAAVYAQKLTALVSRIRTDLHAENVPFLVGTLGDFYVKKHPAAAQINTVLEDLPKTVPNMYVVLARGLTDKGDTTHFDTSSARTLGRRFADAYLAQSKKHK